MSNPFLYKQFYFKQFSLALQHNLIVKKNKTFLYLAIQFSQTVLIKTSFCLQTVKYQNSSTSNNSV